MAGGPIGAGLMVASQVHGAFGQYQAGNAAAATDMENARLTELGGAYEEEGIRRRERAVSGEAIAAMGANGVAVGDGSAADLLFQNALEGQYAALTARYEAAGAAASLRTSAGQKKAAARGALFNGLLRAGASAITGESELGSAAASAKAAEIAREARFPGAQQLPMPANSPWYVGGKHHWDQGG